MEIKVKLMREGATIPTYGTNGAGGFDFYAAETKTVYKSDIVPLGVAMEIPQGYVLLVAPRSSIGLHTTLRMANSIGVVDSDYRGEIGAIYESEKPMTITKGTRIAQGFLVKVPTVDFVVTDELSETDRGHGGFGSTGK